MKGLQPGHFVYNVTDTVFSRGKHKIHDINTNQNEALILTSYVIIFVFIQTLSFSILILKMMITCV